MHPRRAVGAAVLVGFRPGEGHGLAGFPGRGRVGVRGAHGRERRPDLARYLGRGPDPPAGLVVPRPATPAAADAEPPVTSVGDIVVDSVHQRAVVSNPRGGQIVVTDYDGRTIRTVPSLPGANGLELSADSGTLFAAVPGADAAQSSSRSVRPASPRSRSRAPRPRRSASGSARSTTTPPPATTSTPRRTAPGSTSSSPVSAGASDDVCPVRDLPEAFVGRVHVPPDDVVADQAALRLSRELLV